jgi:uncharacterized protein YjiS (DUF1127 family)
MWLMTDFAHNPNTLLAARRDQATFFAAAAKTTWRWLSAPVRAFFERELVLRELNSLGDRDLADIGLSRSDLPAVIRGMYRGDAPRKLDPDA